MKHRIGKSILILILIVSTTCIISCCSNSSNSTNLEEETQNDTGNNILKSEITAEDYKNALDEKTKDQILQVAKKYYDNLKSLTVKSIEVTSDYANYQGKGIEDKYSVGNILIFDVKTTQDDIEYRRVISIAKDSSGEWQVINEGFK